tara:strand:+ start:100 stop:543 length:444 start_codon:yes stop_codon:yes gene_type:complete
MITISDKILSLFTLVFAVYAIAIFVLPFSFYVDVRSTTYHDVCLGESRQLVSNDRTPRWAIEGDAFSQVVYFDGQNMIETTITRSAQFGYEPTDFAQFEVEWSEPFERLGRYGVNEWVTIFPLPFAKVHNLFFAEEQQFNVIYCDKI